MYFNYQDYIADASAFMESNYVVIDETLSLNKGYSLIHSLSIPLSHIMIKFTLEALGPQLLFS